MAALVQRDGAVAVWVAGPDGRAHALPVKLLDQAAGDALVERRTGRLAGRAAGRGRAAAGHRRGRAPSPGPPREHLRRRHPATGLHGDDVGRPDRARVPRPRPAGHRPLPRRHLSLRDRDHGLPGRLPAGHRGVGDPPGRGRGGRHLGRRPGLLLVARGRLAGLRALQALGPPRRGGAERPRQGGHRGRAAARSAPSPRSSPSSTWPPSRCWSSRPRPGPTRSRCASCSTTRSGRASSRSTAWRRCASLGGGEPEIAVDLFPERLRQLGLAPDAVFQRIRAEHLDLPGRPLPVGRPGGGRPRGAASSPPPTSCARWWSPPARTAARSGSATWRWCARA